MMWGLVKTPGQKKVANEIPFRVVSIVDGSVQYDSSLLIIDRAVGINKETKKEIRIYPNPSSSKINIDYTLNKNSVIKLYSITGKLISEHRLNTIDISALSAGVYFLSIVEDNKIIAVESFQRE